LRLDSTPRMRAQRKAASEAKEKISKVSSCLPIRSPRSRHARVQKVADTSLNHEQETTSFEVDRILDKWTSE
ncbi:hypothetical protein PMAYCL1PPCAC_31388, partial [Pristionchus mayeri]